MIWEVELRPLGRDGERERICDEYDLLTSSSGGGDLVRSSSRGYLLEGPLTQQMIVRLCDELLSDRLVETDHVTPLDSATTAGCTVLLKPGVMDPTAQSVLEAAADLGIPLEAVRTFRRYNGPEAVAPADRELLFRRVLANDAIEQVVIGPIRADHLTLGRPTPFRKITVPLLSLDDAGLEELSRSGLLALSLEEMKTVQAHFRGIHRDPTDIELESIAQTWSEHCSHKTLKGRIELTEVNGSSTTTRTYSNLLRETIFGSTVAIRQRMGEADFCVSVFSDNAGVVKFDDDYHVCFKVETHNHPSAIEPYGGANTGLGGVIRDPLGAGLGAKPIANTDVFCFAPPDYPADKLPKGVLHPRRVMQGVVAGVRDYGNRMGIPTVNGAVVFDERYLANPLVYCGTVGLIPVDRIEKAALPGDLIVAVGGRTGRDGIHGATFSSLELTDASETESGGAVQIGNAIAEKKVLDVILQARDRRLYSAITDCGAGGFSSAVGEMGADLGAVVHLHNAPLKYEGLTYTEVWISESQERMVLSVPPDNWPALEALCRSEGVEAAILGTFEATGTLKMMWEDTVVGEVSMHFLHDGRPDVTRSATTTIRPDQRAVLESELDAKTLLVRILSDYSVCSREWIIRQYDHEVQGGSVIKPLVGIKNDGPSDASVIMPVLGSYRGIALSNGINPAAGEVDAYHGATLAIDEAMRNLVAVGADPAQTSILDNFCWGNVRDPEILGSLVRAAEACRDVALAFGTPFISGKDSLNNEYRSDTRRISIPGTLLISAMGIVPDVRKCVTMDFKSAGNLIFLVGITRGELAGSMYMKHQKGSGGSVPKLDMTAAPQFYRAIHEATKRGLLRACHDLSEGGLAVSLAEMAFAGGLGAEVEIAHLAGTMGIADDEKLFSESPTRWLIEVTAENESAVRKVFADLPLSRLGTVRGDDVLRVSGMGGVMIEAKIGELKEAWQKPLRW